jgi:mannobiose 2-epimerase
VNLQHSWSSEIRAELLGNILPFWINRVQRPDGRGFYGVVQQNGTADANAALGLVMVARIAWTFSAVTKKFGERYAAVANRAVEELRTSFLDTSHGGLYWMVSPTGKPISTRKQVYAQAFGIYALSEHYMATGSRESLELAIALYQLLERYTRDPEFGGYYEAFSADWSPIEDLRLSEKDLNCPKSMNTILHVMEAYTNLLRAWPNPRLRDDLAALISLMMDKIVDIGSGRLKLFFDRQWHSLSQTVSFGHDIEASWLLVEAADVLGETVLIDRAKDIAIRLAKAVLAHGVNSDGSINYEAHADFSQADTTRHWWVQAEAAVGFFNAYQITGQQEFDAAARNVWHFISERVVDHVNGEWHAKLDNKGAPLSGDPEMYKAGPWKCPYHNARACLELLARIGTRS